MPANENSKMIIQKMKPTRLVYGHGVNDLDKPVRHLKFYSTWNDMLQRCYSKKYQDKRPTYRGCSVCDEWLSLSNFKEWFDVNYRTGMELDKDILIQGNKVYSPETSRFVPGYINSLLLDGGASRGELPCGVSAHRSNSHGQIITTYQARCWDGHGKRHHKTFSTIPEARQWYVMKKKEVVREIVLDAFWRNEIMSDVATALLEREW